MRVGVAKEIKNHEYRVGLTPAGALALGKAGHEVWVEAEAGTGSAFTDQEYQQAGAKIIDEVRRIFEECEMIIKVKEPLNTEWPMLQEGQLLFTYLHLAPLRELTDGLLDRKVTGVAYETITGRGGSLPLLTPMSEVAGRMASLVGAYFLQRPFGGRGTLLAGVPGVPPGDVVILGGGIVGLNATKVALGMGARVTVLDTNLDRLRFFDDIYHGQVTTLASNPLNVANAVRRADVLIGAVLVPGRSAPMLVTRAMISTMKPGSVVVDVAVDQGGCVETTRATTHAEPTFLVGEVLHYGVANMPGAVPRTSTFALTNATLPYALALATKGLRKALADDSGLRPGVNTYGGYVTSLPVAESQGRAYTDLAELLPP